MKEKDSLLVQVMQAITRGFRRIYQNIRLMFQPSFLHWLPRAVMFVLLYTVAYFAFTKTMRYTLPFLIALLLAWIMQPMMRFLTQRLRWKRGLASTVVLVLLIVVIMGLLVLLIWRLVVECVMLIERVADIDFSSMLTFLTEWAQSNGIEFWKPDTQEELSIQEFLLKNQNKLRSAFDTSSDLAGKVLNAVVSFVGSLPSVVMIVIVVFFATFYFCRDMFGVEKKENRVFRPRVINQFGKFYRNGLALLGRYLTAYLKLILISGAMTFVAFLVLGLPYPVVFGVLAAFLDLFPVIGVSLIYIPAAVIYAAQGNWTLSIWLIVVLVLITVVRQIAELKMISESINVYPLIPLSCLFLSIQAGNAQIFIFLMGLVLLYVLLRHSGFFDGPSPAKEFRDIAVNAIRDEREATEKEAEPDATVLEKKKGENSTQ